MRLASEADFAGIDAPKLFSAAVDGTTKDIGLKNEPIKNVQDVFNHLKNISTATVRDLSRPVISSSPSVQGPWDPSTTFDAFQIRIAEPKPAQEQLR